MLKLNSQYGKSYLRDAPAEPARQSTGGQYYGNYEAGKKEEKPRTRMTPEDDISPRGTYDFKSKYDAGKTTDYIPQDEGRRRQGRDGGYGYVPSYNEKIPERNSELVKNSYDYSRGTSRNYDQISMENDYGRDKSPQNYGHQRSAVDMESYRQNDPSSDFGGSKPVSGYSRYSGRTTTPVEPRYTEKKDYAAAGTGKHTKRNQDVRNRILKEQQNYPVGREGYSRGGSQYDNEKPERSTYDNYLNEGNSPFDSYKEEDNYQNIRQDYSYNYKNEKKGYAETTNDWRNDRDATGRKSGFDMPISLPSQQLKLNRRGSQEYNSIKDKFQRPSLQQRKETIKKSIENTPERNYKGCKFEPGSSERKQSLIQKSQMLQQKLKKLNTQLPSDKDPAPSQQSTSSYAQPSSSYSRPSIKNQDPYSKQTAGTSIIQSNRSNSCLRNNFKNVNISEQNELSANAIARNADIMRPRSPYIPEERTSNNNEPVKNSEAIDKITKLNEKINERIQSIISNYANK